MAEIYNDTVDAGADLAIDLHLFSGPLTDTQADGLQAAATIDAPLLATLALTPVDLTGASSVWYIGRAMPAGKYVLKLTPTLTSALGRVALRASAAETALLAPFRTCAYFVRITWADGTKERLLEGTLRINPEVAGE